MTQRSGVSRAERRRLETRAELVRTAQEVFVERGYHATRIGDIVGRMGAGQGTFYRYFDSKRDALDAVLESLLERVRKAFTEDNAPDAIGSLEEYRQRAGLIVDQIFGLADEEMDLVRFLAFELASVDRAAVGQLLVLSSVFEAVIADYYRAGIERGYFRADVDLAAAATATLGIGVGGLLMVLKDPSDADARRAYRDTIVEFIVRFAARDPRGA
jgi:AcrR family transcriptional regulator